MAKGNFSATTCIKEHLDITYKRTKSETKEKYAAVLYNINSILKENGQETNPRKMDENTINFLLRFWDDLAISTKNWYLHILNRYLKHFKNEIIEDMQIELGYDERPNVDWLSKEECDLVLKTRLSPLEDTVIHLELCMGLRVSEVCNLMVKDVHFDKDPSKRFIAVLGKGHGIGKWRSIPFHPLSQQIFETWMKRRHEIVRTIRMYNPYWVDPGNFLIWCHYKDKPTGGKYTERGHSLDRAVIHVVRDRLGLTFTNHTLRRTFGRNLYHSGVPIETISAMYGHDNIKTTLAYIGINLDDMNAALAKMYEHQISQSGIDEKED